jgi:hypothetical protein
VYFTFAVSIDLHLNISTDEGCKIAENEFGKYA